MNTVPRRLYLRDRVDSNRMQMDVRDVDPRRAQELERTIAVLSAYLPWTVRAVTEGRELWLQDLGFEYLVHHRWESSGEQPLAECARFLSFVRDRIAKRRVLRDEAAIAMALESAALELLESSTRAKVIEVGADVGAWFEGGD